MGILLCGDSLDRACFKLGVYSRLALWLKDQQTSMLHVFQNGNVRIT